MDHTVIKGLLERSAAQRSNAERLGTAPAIIVDCDVVDDLCGLLGVNALLAAATRNQLSRLVALLLEDGLLSEAQIARICIAHPDLVEVRKLHDEGLASLHKMPLSGDWGAATSKRLGLRDASDLTVQPHPGDPCLDCDGCGKDDLGGPCAHCDGTGGACDE